MHSKLESAKRFVDYFVDKMIYEIYHFFIMAVQVRVNESTHAVISSLAKELGESMQSIVDKAVERYKREVFLENLNQDFKRLRENEAAWASEVEERRLWENTLLDGIDK